MLINYKQLMVSNACAIFYYAYIHTPWEKITILECTHDLDRRLGGMLVESTVDEYIISEAAETEHPCYYTCSGVHHL